MEKSFDSLSVLLVDLKRRLKTTRLSTTFYTHLLFVVILGGSIGVWFPLLQGGWKMENIATTVLTYFPVIVAVALLEFIEEDQLYLRNFGLSSAFILGVIFLIAATRNDPDVKYYWALLGTVLSVVLWWIANGENPRFRDYDPNNAVAGPLDAPLAGKTPPGFKVD
jgi:hypothetical protein